MNFDDDQREQPTCKRASVSTKNLTFENTPSKRKPNMLSKHKNTTKRQNKSIADKQEVTVYCTCRRSGCVKLYCACKLAGLECGTLC